MKSVLITGSSGFLGSHLTESLVGSGYKVTILKRSRTDTWRIKHLLPKLSSFDVDKIPVEDIFKFSDIDVVIHTACDYGRDMDSEYRVFKSNVDFPLRLLKNACDNNVGLFINTDSFFSKPEFELGYMAPYVLSKRHFYDWLKLFKDKLKVVNMQLEHIYGPRDGQSKFTSYLCDRYINSERYGKKIELSSCKQERDFIYIDDVVSAFDRVLHEVDGIESGMLFEVGRGKGIPVRSFVEIFDNKFSKYVKNDFEITFNPDKDRKGEILRSIANTKELSAIGWRPSVEIEEGIERLIRNQLNV